jgi:DNA-binding beta-propeller fold protein YncE
MRARLVLIAFCHVAAVLWPGGSIATETGAYSLVGHIEGSGGAWDYAIIDTHSGRLFLAQSGVTAVDLKTNAITTGFVAGGMTHGLALLGDGTIAVDDSRNKTITIFDGASGKIVTTIATADFNPVSGVHALDALVVEPKTGLLIAVNGESGLVLLIDVKKAGVVGTVSVGGHPEFAAANGTGRIYINVNRGKSSEIAAIDAASRRVVKRIPLDGCEGATGMAYDQADKLIISVCDNGVVKAFDEQAERVVASLAVGPGADAVMFDSVRRRAFVASGDDGTLSVIAVRGNRDISLVQTVKTQIGTRLGAVDIGSGRVYLPSAKFGPPKAPIPYPTVVPGTFRFLIAASN